MSQPTKPSAFEVASLAAQLAARDNKSSLSPAANYIPEAERLLKAAAKYCERPSAAEENKKMISVLGFKLYSFDDVLKTQAPALHGRILKKGTTMTGAITTALA